MLITLIMGIFNFLLAQTYHIRSLKNGWIAR